MNSRQLQVAILMFATVFSSSVAQAKKKKIKVDPPPTESVLASTSIQSNPVLSDLMTFKPEMPLGPQDILKSYEIAMSLVAAKTSSDFTVIVQAQQANQVTRDQAEYLLQERYELAMMQYQVLSALHDVLEHDIDAATPAKSWLKTTRSDAVLMVPFPGPPSGSR